MQDAFIRSSIQNHDDDPNPLSAATQRTTIAEYWMCTAGIREAKEKRLFIPCGNLFLPTAKLLNDYLDETLKKLSYRCQIETSNQAPGSPY